MSPRPSRALMSPFGAWRQLRRKLRESNDSLERSLRASGSGSLAHFEALEYLLEADGEAVPQSELQEALGFSQSSTSRMVARLEAQGLVRRVLSATDGRAWLVELTPTGAATIHQDLSRYVPLIRSELRALTEGLLPTTAPGAEALLLQTDDGGEGDRILPFGESLFAMSQSTPTAAEAVILRNALEPQLLLDASQHWTPDDMAECREILDEMRANVAEPLAYFQADWDLHRRLLAISKNTMLQHIYRGLLSVVENNVDDVIPTRGLDEYLQERLAVHVEMVDAVASRNPDLVRRAVRRHNFSAADLPD